MIEGHANTIDNICKHVAGAMPLKIKWLKDTLNPVSSSDNLLLAMPLKIKWLKDTVRRAGHRKKPWGYAVENKVIEGHSWPKSKRKCAANGYAVENKVIEGHSWVDNGFYRASTAMPLKIKWLKDTCQQEK